MRAVSCVSLRRETVTCLNAGSLFLPGGRPVFIRGAASGAAESFLLISAVPANLLFLFFISQNFLSERQIIRPGFLGPWIAGRSFFFRVRRHRRGCCGLAHTAFMLGYSNDHNREV